MSKYKNTETMKIAEAAKLMHKNPCFIRQGIIDGRLEFGRAVCSNGRWNFYINRNKFLKLQVFSLSRRTKMERCNYCPLRNHCLTQKKETDTCDDMIRRYNASLLLPPQYVERSAF